MVWIPLKCLQIFLCPRIALLIELGSCLLPCLFLWESLLPLSSRHDSWVITDLFPNSVYLDGMPTSKQRFMANTKCHSLNSFPTLQDIKVIKISSLETRIFTFHFNFHI
uniref:Uncharacterized protein n=1 Tax=Cacopsylla melanoneura TaxID=428564 RepID=A0A8D9ARG6_9HEMI